MYEIFAHLPNTQNCWPLFFPHHSQSWSQHRSSSLLGHQTQMLKSLCCWVYKGRGKRRVITLYHGIAGDDRSWTAIAQLSEVRHHIRNTEGRVRVQRDGRDLKLLVAQTGGVESLEVEDDHVKIHTNHEQWSSFSLFTSGFMLITQIEKLWSNRALYTILQILSIHIYKDFIYN